MDSLSELLDPSDWLQTSLPHLTPLESGLRCQVCKDFYDTPMITSCSHTFCSLCIRRCLTSDGKCPACRSPDQEIRLRRNWSVQEIVDAFRHARPTLIQLATTQSSSHKELNAAKEKRKYKELNEYPSENINRRATRQKPLREALNVSKSSEDKSKYVVENIQVIDAEPDNDLRACPICQQRMKEEDVFPHLDIHTQREHETDVEDYESRYTPSTSCVSSNSLSNCPERLPQLNYSLFKETALRKKLVDIGIPSGGPKALLVRRHTEWVNLVNSNCDSSRPRTKHELLHDLAEWDRSQGRILPSRLGFAPNSNALMNKEFDGVAWGTAHNKEFQRLIQEARKRYSRVPDESLGSTLEVPERIPASDDVSILKCASISQVSASTDHPNEDVAVELQDSTSIEG